MKIVYATQTSSDVGVAEASKIPSFKQYQNEEHQEIGLTFAGQEGYPLTFARTRSPVLSCPMALTRFPPLLRPGAMAANPQTLTPSRLPGTQPPTSNGVQASAVETLGLLPAGPLSLRSKGGGLPFLPTSVASCGGKIERRRSACVRTAKTSWRRDQEARGNEEGSVVGDRNWVGRRMTEIPVREPN